MLFGYKRTLLTHTKCKRIQCDMSTDERVMFIECHSSMIWLYLFANQIRKSISLPNTTNCIQCMIGLHITHVALHVVCLYLCICNKNYTISNKEMNA